MNLTVTSESPLLTAQFLRTLPAVRERCAQVFELAKRGQLKYFDYHPEHEQDVTQFCIGLMKRDFGSNWAKIPPHGRWRHFVGDEDPLPSLIAAVQPADPENKEACKTLIDLFVVSVLLDAGAGDRWAFQDASGKKYARSEGLAIASLAMFKNGFFSSDPKNPYRVDPTALANITTESLGKHMQVTEGNPIVGLEGRAALLVNLGKALVGSPGFFGTPARPGNLIDFLESESLLEGKARRVPLAALWSALIDGLNPVWPSTRTNLAGIALGDVWPCTALPLSTEGSNLVPFHKLTQWMTYSLIEAISATLKWEFVGVEDMTGLPEYRNGGLLVDLKVLSLKEGVLPLQDTSGLPYALPSHPAIVEWRALTVILLDRTAESIRQDLGLSPGQLNLAQVLESATWKGGREIARKLRPETGGPPIVIESDGTVF